MFTFTLLFLWKRKLQQTIGSFLEHKNCTIWSYMYSKCTFEGRWKSELTVTLFACKEAAGNVTSELTSDKIKLLFIVFLNCVTLLGFPPVIKAE